MIWQSPAQWQYRDWWFLHFLTFLFHLSERQRSTVWNINCWVIIPKHSFTLKNYSIWSIYICIKWDIDYINTLDCMTDNITPQCHLKKTQDAGSKHRPNESLHSKSKSNWTDLGLLWLQCLKCLLSVTWLTMIKLLWK